jgi:Mce-associated membrane protein
MPLRKLPVDALDADNPWVRVLSGAASTSIAEPDELAQAVARAEAARARAIELRQRADAASNGHQAGPEDTDDERDTATTLTEPESAPSRRLLRRPSRKAIAGATAVVLSCAALTASGYLAWQHHNAQEERQRTAEFSAAARDGIVTMLSVNAATARADVQRFVDDTTGEFKVGILVGAEDFVKAVEQSKGSTKGSVQVVAVQSMTKDSAIVLVAAKSVLTAPGQAKPELRWMRLVVNVQRDGGQLRISRVEFIP